MTIRDNRALWQSEEDTAHITGWDFSHLAGRYREEDNLPWDYRAIVLDHLREDMRLLDMDTGGGEFLLTLGHPPGRICVTEGYAPNATLCRQRLEPLGIRVAEVTDPSRLPYPDGAFHLVINRHGSYDPAELFRILTPGGCFITQQVGEENDRALIDLLLPGTPKAFPGHNAQAEARRFHQAGFTLLRAEEAFRPIRFFDVGALVWFARVLPWEFPGFSVDACMPRLLRAQALLDARGEIRGDIHRFLLIARKD